MREPSPHRPNRAAASGYREHRGGEHPADSLADPASAPFPARGGEAGPARRTEVEVHRHLLFENERQAEGIRRLLAEHEVFSINVMSSPGSGKTALLEATLARLEGELRIAIIEGDIETSADADRLRRFSAQVIQINTGPFGGDCHLAAPLIARAIGELDLHCLDLLIVENVGNLVCPAEFDIGEDRKIVLLSVTEGEDKPLKYPLMFHEASLALITKVDLLPHLDVRLENIQRNLNLANPALPVLELSALRGQGMEEWVAWLREGVSSKRETAR